MNAFKLTLILGTLISVLTAGVLPTAADTVVWDGSESSDWFDNNNWQDGARPTAADDVVIPQSSESVLISSDNSENNAACKTLDMGNATVLTIKGLALILGDADYDTTSTLDNAVETFDATIRLVKNSSGDPGTLALKRWVTFEGGGTIWAPSSADAGVIQRVGSVNDKGMIIPSNTVGELDLIGNIDIRCDFDHSNVHSFVGTNSSGQVMTFGLTSGDGPERVPDIKGAGKITAESGAVRFAIVDFDGTTAPWWWIKSGTMQLTDQADSDAYLLEVFDITMEKFYSGTLDLDNNLATAGTLAVFAGPNSTHTIEVAADIAFQAGQAVSP